MTNPYQAMLILLLPLVGCDDKEADDSGTTTSKTDDTGSTTPITASEQGCMQLPADLTECPAETDVSPDDLIPQTCGATVISVDGPGSLEDGCGWIGGFAPVEWCLYPITVIPPDTECDYGRPLVIDGAPRVATLVRREEWTGSRRALPEGDKARAEIWARIGLAEHASIASFHRFALELMALGAPAALVGLAADAARDELRHAQLAFGLASEFAGVAVGPGVLPLNGLSMAQDLVTFAEATAREGCVAETLSALQMAEARDLATDPREHAILEGIARDEARHAALAWQALRWAIDQGGAPVREAVAAVFARAPELPGEEARGLLPAGIAQRSMRRGWAEVIRPAAEGLLGA